MDCLNKFVPTKLTSKRQNLPWLIKSLRKAIRKKARLYNRAKTSKRPDLWAKYKVQKRDTQQNLWRTRWSFINDKLLTSLETQNSKPFWCYIKSQRQDRCGVSPLLHYGQLHSDSRRKAEILKLQFCSVFTDEDTTNMPKLEGTPTSDMDNIEITQSGITKFLSELNMLNADEAPGPNFYHWCAPWKSAGQAKKTSPRFYPWQASAGFPRYLNSSRFPHCSVQTVLMMSS